MAKTRHCHIILMPEPHERAWQWLYQQKAAALPEDTKDRYKTAREQMQGWLGPQFDNIKNVSFTDGWIHVLLHDSTSYSYPRSEVARVKTFITED